MYIVALSSLVSKSRDRVGIWRRNLGPGVLYGGPGQKFQDYDSDHTLNGWLPCQLCGAQSL
jgi:hypothetical protein